MAIDDEKWRKALRTLQDIGGSLSGGALKAFESIADLGTRAVALTGEAFGADTQKIWDFADKDLVQDWYHTPLGTNQRDSESYLNEWKYGDTTRNIANMIGGLAGSIVMGGMAKGLVPAGASDFVRGAVGTLPIGLKQAGSASGKASQYLKQQNLGQDISFSDKTKAMAYGTMSGLAEWGISNISGAGAIAGLTPKSGLGEIAKGALGEGFETILSNIADPILQKTTYKPDTNILLGDSANLGERAKSVGSEALLSALISGGLQAGQYGMNKLKMQGDERVLDELIARPKEDIDTEKIDTEKIDSEIEQTKINEDAGKTTEQLFEELQADEYGVDPYKNARKSGGSSEIQEFEDFYETNRTKGEEYVSQVPTSMKKAKNKKEQMKIDESTKAIRDSENMAEKTLLANQWLDERVGMGDNIDPDSNTVKAIIGADNSRNESLIAALNDRVIAASRDASGDRLYKLDELSRELYSKLGEESHKFGVEGNEIQYVNSDSLSGMVKSFEKTLEGKLKSDSDYSYMKDKVNPENYAMTPERRRAIEDIYLAKDVEIAQARTKKDFLLADTLVDERNEKMFLEATKDIPVKIGEKLKEWRQVSFLFNPRTLFVRNLWGNVEAGGLDKTNFVKTIMNKVNSEIQGVDTGLSAKETMEMQKIYAENLYNGFAGKSGKAGSNKYESEITKKGLSREGIFGKVADLTYKLLDKVDSPFYKATFESEFFRSKKILQKNIASGKIKDIPEDKLDLMAYTAAKQKADTLTFKDDNNWTKSVTELKDKMNNIFHLKARYGMGLGDQLVTFLKTPVNVAKMAYDHLPMGLIKSSKAYKTALANLNEVGSAANLMAFDKASQEVAKGAYGTVMLLAAGAMGYYGVLEVNEHKRGQQDQTTFNKQMLGKQGMVLNIGDKKIPLANFDLANILLSPVAATMNKTKEWLDKDEEDREDFSSIIIAGGWQQAEAFLEQASLKTFNQWLEGFQANGAEGMLEAMGRTFAGIPSEYIPTVIQQTAKAIDPYERQVYERGMLGNAMNQVVAGIPGARQLLPEKVNVYGEKMQNFDDSGSFVGHLANKMILPNEIKNKDNREITNEIERIANSTGENVYPYAVRSREDGKDLKAQEISDKQRIAGERYLKNAEALLKTNKYQEADDAGKAKMLKELAKTPSKQEMKHGAEPIAEKDMGEATTFNMLSKSGIDPQYLKDIKYAGGTQQDKLEAVANLDISGDQKLILFKSLYPDNKGIPDEALIQAMVNTGMSREEILNYSKLLGVVLDANPLRLDTDVEDREAYNDMLYGLKAVDEKDTMKNAVYQVLPENAPEILQQAETLAKNPEQLLNYLSNLEIDGIQKLILYKKIKPNKDEQIDNAIGEYIVNLDIDNEQKKRILRELKII